MKYNIFLILVFILYFSINSFAYNIDTIDTKIIVKDNGVLQITDTILLKDVSKNDEIILPMLPVYDLKIKTENKGITYSYSLDNLKINLNNCCLVENSITLQVIYLTDFYTYKNGFVWSINYFPIFREYVDTFSVYFLKDTELNNFSGDYKNITIKDNRFVFTSLETTSSFDVEYIINPNIVEDKKFNPMIGYFIIFILFFVLSYFSFKRLFKKNKKSKDLLLGLNENEQKIIKVVMEKNGLLQKNLSKECFLPKGTVSRNLKKLESKGYIDIKRYGVNKKVFLGTVFSKK